MRPWTLEQRVALVTGGSGGIGTATAAALLDAGGRVAITSRDGASLDKAAARLGAGDDQLLAVPCDVSEEDQVGALVDRVTRQFGTVDILIHLAADPGQIGRPTWEIDASIWHRAVEVNLVGAFLPTRAVLPAMLEQGSGRILHVSSTALERPFAGGGPYGAAKAAVRHLIETLALELHGTDVTVVGFNPGPADTPTFRHVAEALAPQHNGWPRALAGRDPSEAARMILWLCSPATAHLSGVFVSWRDHRVRQALAQFAPPSAA